MSPSVAATDLVKRFGDLSAVDDVTFDVAPGEVVGLLGANGAGKTTTIKMLIGLLAPSGGSAQILGRTPGPDVRRRLGYVPQGLGLYSDLTVAQNFSFVARSYGVRDARLPSTLRSVERRLVRDVPLGTQRQLAFACALQHRPEVLILDEPTSGVEPLGASRLWDRIRSEAERGVGVLVSTHSMLEAQECDRLLLMADGRIVGEGTEEDIVGATKAVVVRADGWKEAFDVLSREGWIVMLAGRTVRVVDEEAPAVLALLECSGIDATVEVVRATIDERMAALAAR
jgi:ABC-2 type transport system ATP-binding protein/ribosome-dependent ATPase